MSSSKLTEMDRSRKEVAQEYMQNGYMCSESVVMAYAARFGLCEELAAKISGGFAGGMAQGSVCGALSGAVMALGLRYGMGMVRDQNAKELCFEKIRELFHRFERRCQATECRRILLLNGFDPSDPDLNQKLRQSGVCFSTVRHAVEIVEELFTEEDENPGC